MTFSDDDWPVSGPSEDALQDLDDPESRLMRREESGENDEEEEGSVLGRLDVLLREFSADEREMLRLVMEEDLPVAAAAREAGVTGNVHQKLKKMLDKLRERV